jgi:hypothetical protein
VGPRRSPSLPSYKGLRFPGSALISPPHPHMGLAAEAEAAIPLTTRDKIDV